MTVNIYSLKKVLFHGEASAVNCTTAAGNITVLDNHRPLISVLPAGVLKVTNTAQKDHYFTIMSGFLEVQKANTMRLLVEE
jgi:F0F1-type ATP synthase epsilon subunit